MIHVNSYLHRVEFHDLVRRWMYNDPAPDDADRIARLVHFNNTYIARYLHRFSEWMFGALHPAAELRRFTARTKAEVKDAIGANPPYVNPRIAELLSDYREHPEHFYRETPFDGTLFFAGQNGRELYAGSTRIKRVRRLAEKAARRIVDRIFEAIKLHAEALAENRARALGIPIRSLLTEPQDMVSEFLWAEKRLQEDLRTRRKLPLDEELVINDVAGIKVILDDAIQPRVLELLRANSACEIVEVEPHKGVYNATNLIVDHRPDKAAIAALPLSRPLLELMQLRGHDPADLQRDFKAFVETGEESVYLELIICNYQEMLESEIGRCMHEDRIIQQRLQQEYRGHLSKNVEYLMEYMFAVAHSRHRRIDALPIKLWNRYLADFFDDAIKGLYDIPSSHLYL